MNGQHVNPAHGIVHEGNLYHHQNGTPKTPAELRNEARALQNGLPALAEQQRALRRANREASIAQLQVQLQGLLDQPLPPTAAKSVRDRRSEQIRGIRSQIHHIQENQNRNIVTPGRTIRMSLAEGRVLNQIRRLTTRANELNNVDAAGADGNNGNGNGRRGRGQKRGLVLRSEGHVASNNENGNESYNVDFAGRKYRKYRNYGGAKRKTTKRKSTTTKRKSTTTKLKSTTTKRKSTTTKRKSATRKD